jgi:DHA1 family inner membrane transport protein
LPPEIVNLPLLALAAAAFGIGTTEFVIMGLLPDVARDFGVTAPQAGMLVSGYAIGVTIGAPILAVATARWPRKKALIGLMLLFILGNGLCAIAPTYEFLMVARVVTAFCHAAFFGIGAVVAAGLVPREKRAQAVALMFTGLTVANVLGVPLGTALGHAAGWRSTFWAVTGIGAVAVLALAHWLPSALPAQEGSILREFKAIVRTQVQFSLLISTLASVSMFSVLTYIAYILRDVTGFTPDQASWALMLFGAGITVGGLVGGRLADWRLMPAMAGLFACIAVVLAVFSWSSHHPVPALATLFVWGIVAFAVGPAAQVRVLDTATGAPNLASTLNQGAFNLGNAGGAWLGGLLIAADRPLTELSWLGAGVAVVALGVVVLAAQLDRTPRLAVQTCS